MKCGIIKDLLPSYIDELTSEDSNQEIEAHLENCSDCNQYYKEMLTKEKLLMDDEEFDFCWKTSNINSEKGKELEILKSFNRKRRSLIALTWLLVCITVFVCTFGVAVCVAPLGVFVKIIPYEEAQPYVEVSDVTTCSTDYNGGTEHTQYWHGIWYETKTSMLKQSGVAHACRKLTINGEEKNVYLFTETTTYSQYWRHKDELGNPALIDVKTGTWSSDYILVDLVYYVDESPKEIMKMSTEEEILEWIDTYGHLMWERN